MYKQVPLIDWFKAIGIFLIVLGHTNGYLINNLTAPVGFKQIGVIFFIFIMGWQISQDKRETKIILFNRLFKILFWSAGFVLFMSILGLVFENKVYRSNYMPFFVGVNVLFDFFPANPPIWFIGTYIHILILWAIFLKKIKVSRKLILVSMVFEILIRGVLMRYGAYRSYMLFFNWQTVFFLGMYCGQNNDKNPAPGLWVSFLMYGSFIFMWGVGVSFMNKTSNFPFRIFEVADTHLNYMVTSFLVTLVYSGHAIFFYLLCRHLPANKISVFFARHSLIIFLAHIPLWNVIAPHIKSLIAFYPLRLAAELAILFVGIGLVSSLLLHIIPASRIQSHLFQQVFQRNEAPFS
jgi:hypothetical protein